MDVTALRRSIADSEIEYPNVLGDRVKYAIAQIWYPFHNDVRDALLRLRLVKHEGRQDHTLGRLAPGKTVEGFLKHLEGQGFGNHFIAWEDRNELIGLRRTDGFKYQYHLRIFTDGEVRGHYEYTPEAHPVWHIKEVGMEDRRDDFLEFCGDWIVRTS